MTMHTKPLSPWVATLYPAAVSILTVAWADTFSGAALFASALSASGVIMYSPSGGYLGLCASRVAASRVATRKTMPTVSFFILDRLLIEITLAFTVTARDDASIRNQNCHEG